MIDDFTTPEEPAQSTVAHVAETLQSASRHVSDAIETSRQPGMPLDIVTRMVREAPLASLAIAFMLGVTFSRKR
jgi:hypothetical protein